MIRPIVIVIVIVVVVAAGRFEKWLRPVREPQMPQLQHILVGAMDPGRFDAVIQPAEHEALLELIERSAVALQGRVIWNVNLTAKGGGVVELLRPLLGYSRGAGSTPAESDLSRRGFLRDHQAAAQSPSRRRR